MESLKSEHHLQTIDISHKRRIFQMTNILSRRLLVSNFNSQSYSVLNVEENDRNKCLNYVNIIFP